MSAVVRFPAGFDAVETSWGLRDVTGPYLVVPETMRPLRLFDAPSGVLETRVLTRDVWSGVGYGGPFVIYADDHVAALAEAKAAAEVCDAFGVLLRGRRVALSADRYKMGGGA